MTKQPDEMVNETDKKTWPNNLKPALSHQTRIYALLASWSVSAVLIAAPLPIQAQVYSSYNASVPLVYEEPGERSGRGPDSSFGVETIDPFTGTLKIVATDLVVPSNGGLNLKVVRNYQSFQKVTGVSEPTRDYLSGRTATGIGWDLHFGRLWRGPGASAPSFTASNSHGCRILNATSKDNPVFELPDGSRQLFAASDSTANDIDYISSDRWILKCLPTSSDTYSDGGAIVVSPEGIKYTLNFYHRVSDISQTSNNSNYAYHVTRIEHPNGTSITISYLSKSSSYYASLQTVSHSEGHSISFSYSNANSQTSAHLSSFSHAGRTWSFDYTGATVPSTQEYLESVERPDGRHTIYEYNSKSSATAANPDGVFSLKKITTALGGTTEYTYEQKYFPTRDVTAQLNSSPRYVVTKKQVRRNSPVSTGTISGSANVDTWTYNYRASTSNTDTSDYTDVAGPTNCITYEHYVGQTSGEGWRVGLLLSKKIASPNSSSSTLTCSSSSVLRSETYSWEELVVSSQDAFRHPAIIADANTYAPRLAQRAITQDGTTYTTSFNDPDSYGNAEQIVETGRTALAGGTTQSVSRTTNYTYFIDVTA